MHQWQACTLNADVALAAERITAIFRSVDEPSAVALQSVLDQLDSALSDARTSGSNDGTDRVELALYNGVIGALHNRALSRSRGGSGSVHLSVAEHFLNQVVKLAK